MPEYNFHVSLAFLSSLLLPELIFYDTFTTVMGLVSGISSCTELSNTKFIRGRSFRVTDLFKIHPTLFQTSEQYRTRILRNCMFRRD